MLVYAQSSCRVLLKHKKPLMETPSTRAVTLVRWGWRRVVLVVGRGCPHPQHRSVQVLVVHPNEPSGTHGVPADKPVEQTAFGIEETPESMKLSSGLTPPTAHIVQRRFEKTRRSAYPVRVVTCLVRLICMYVCVKRATCG